MRTLFTALAFLIILLAVIPAVKRSLAAAAQPAEAGKRPAVAAKEDEGGGQINAEV
jgi:hypothetical protein